MPAANVYSDNTATRYTASVVHDNAGIITVTMGAAAPVATPIQNYTFTLTPQIDVASNNITGWVCATAGNAKYLPSGCQ